MSFLYKIKNGPHITSTQYCFAHVAPYMIIGGISALTISVPINDIYCRNILKPQQYQLKNLLNSKYCIYYNAKYTKLFISSITILGLLGGWIWNGYTNKPLISFICAY
tara:strand:+ start:148 stop:471 length:324 start_codon:yes stop_codon:yes gene_type:complete